MTPILGNVPPAPARKQIFFIYAKMNTEKLDVHDSFVRSRADALQSAMRMLLLMLRVFSFPIVASLHSRLNPLGDDDYDDGRPCRSDIIFLSHTCP